MDALEENAHPVRITSQGKIKNWVTFALNSFEEKPDVPLTFHTISPAKGSNEGGKNPNGTRRLNSSVTLAPRLISVVEIVKREYLRNLATNRSPRLQGLHQYNEIGMLEDEVPAAPEEESVSGAAEKRSEKIIEALAGKNHVKQTQTPFMRITLSLTELPNLQAKGATYQPPTTRKLSKSAKARANRRKKRAAEQEAPTSPELAGEPMDI